MPALKPFNVTVEGKDQFPPEPSQKAVEDAYDRCPDEELHRKMEDVFEERPLWTQFAIVTKSGIDSTDVDGLLQKFAFFIKNGPWGRLWCRFGYDPREDPSAVQFQTIEIDFRIEPKIPELQKLERSRIEERNVPDEHIQYRKGQSVPPRKMWYCLCDVMLPESQEIVRECKTTRYSAAHGFFPGPEYLCESVLDVIRTQIKSDLTSTHPELINSIIVHSNDRFPSEPSKDAVDDAIKRFPDEMHTKMEDAFKERPMWTHFAVYVKTGLEYTRIEALLQKYAFYIWTGPWAHLWCRFGYDPREDPSALQYQTVAVNFRNIVKFPEEQRLELLRLDVSTSPEALFQYRPDRLPRLREMLYCLRDVMLPIGQERAYLNVTTPCDVTYGYLKKGMMDYVRMMIKHDVMGRNPDMTFSICVNANDEFPTRPAEGVVNDVDDRFMTANLRAMMEDIFKERPAWTRFAIAIKTGLGRNDLHFLIPKFAFFIKDGPWGQHQGSARE